MSENLRSKLDVQREYIARKMIPCPDCGNLMDYRSTTCRRCMRTRRRCEDGMRFHSSGRVLIYEPNHPSAVNGYVYRSRFIAEDKLGRYLKDDEMVHHVNGNFQDDRPENMLISTNSYHRDLHNWMAHLYMQEHFWRI